MLPWHGGRASRPPLHYRGPMKLFECQHCGQPLYFENTRCESCGLELGYLPAKETVTALKDSGPNGLRAMADELTRLKGNTDLKRIVLVSHQDEFVNSFPVGWRLSRSDTGTIAEKFRRR